MKISFLSLAILAIAATGVQSVSAQEQQQRPGARFNFPVNYYRVEQPTMPKGYGAPAPVSSVKAGSVPSSSMLGLDPQILTRPQVAARPVSTNVASRAFIPKAVPQVAYNPSFGTPFPGAPAQSPAMGMPAPAMTRTAPAKPVHAFHAPVGRSHVKTGVAGRLRTPIHHSAQPQIASYGNGMGYTPGGHLPSQTGSGMSAHTNVSGQVLRQQH